MGGGRSKGAKGHASLPDAQRSASHLNLNPRQASSFVPGLNHDLKVLRPQTASLHDALEGSNWDGLGSVKRNDDLPSLRVSPLLMAARLINLLESVPAKSPRHLFGVANRKPTAHAAETANTLARPGNLILDGLNQRAKA
jgi:hypothetical protein